MKNIVSNSIGEAWLEACKCISLEGKPIKDGSKPIKELLHLSLTIQNPRINDEIIEKYADKGMIDWMVANFLEQKHVPELRNSLSYGTRLFNYNGKNQVEWVINKLRQKPETKAATIPMLMPNQDNAYIPCVSLLDFKIRGDKLMLIAMCRSIDFGKKVYANIIALHKIQQIISEGVGVPTGQIVMYVTSAHIYQRDNETIEGILKAK